MWGSMQEWRKHPLSEDRVMEIFVACFNAKISEAQLRQVMKTTSYMYHAATGIPKKNYPTMGSILISLDTRKCRPAKKTVTPLHILGVPGMCKAFTSKWRGPDSGMTFVEFMHGCLAGWDGWVLGSRPSVDLGKIKASTEHWWDDRTLSWSTGYKGGRSKLELQKAGTRPWRAWRLCTCPEENHVPPEPDFPFSLDRWGNPTGSWSKYCTCCPLFIGQLLKRAQPAPFRPYRKYLTSESRSKHGRSRWGAENIGDLPALARDWFKYQGVHTVSPNSGRKTLARVSSATKTPHHELVHVMGDNPDTWRKSYQPDYPYTNYKGREQSLDPEVATAFLKRFRKLIGRAAPPKPPPTGLTRGEQMMWIIGERLGLEEAVRSVFD